MFSNFRSLSTREIISVIILMLLLTVAVLYSSLIPPFQSPDENDHIKRAYMLSKGRIAMITPDGGSTGTYIDAGLNEYLGQYNHIPFKTNIKILSDQQSKAAAIEWSGSEKFSSAPGINYYFPLIYFPQAVGLFVGQALNLTVEKTYYMARYLALLSSLVILLTAFSVYRPNAFVVAILFMPLAIFQLVSTSQDGFAVALIVLTVSLYLKITTDAKNYKLSHFYCMCVCVLLLTTSRINLLPMLLLPFAAVYLASAPKRNYLIALLVTFSTAVWLIYALATTVDNRVNIGASTTEIIVYYVKDPIEFFSVLSNTLQNERMRNQYISSFIGIMGWLDTSIGKKPINIIFYSLLIILFLSFSWKKYRADVIARSVLILIALSSVLLTFFLLLITWSKHPAEVISGVQGRYFWGPAILIGYALGIAYFQMSSVKQIITGALLLVIFSVSIFVAPGVLINRYFIGNTSTAKIVVDNKNFREIKAVMHRKESHLESEKGGFIDKIEYKDGRLLLNGWGYFSKDEKRFLSNLDHDLTVRYVTNARQDVANAFKDEMLIYSGFYMSIDFDRIEDANQFLSGFCLYTQDPIYGLKQVQPGNPKILYKCANQ